MLFNGRKHKEMDKRSEENIAKSFWVIIYISLQERKGDCELSNNSKIVGGYSKYPFMVYKYF